MSHARSAGWRVVGLLGAAIALLAILRPWTVRPLKTEQAAFDAASYVEGVWTRLVEDAARSAVDLRGARDTAAAPVPGGAPARRALFVRVTGTLVAVDRQSRVGLARLRPSDEPAGEAVVQIGPVIRGTAVRDAARFIRFNDFSNQFEFAAVSNALHARLLRDVVAPVGFDRLVGQSLTVLGATSVQAGAPGGTPVDIVPIQITTGGGPR